MSTAARTPVWPVLLFCLVNPLATILPVKLLAVTVTFGPGVELAAAWMFGPAAGAVVAIVGRALAAMMLRPLSKKGLASVWGEAPYIAIAAISAGVAGQAYQMLAPLNVLATEVSGLLPLGMNGAACFFAASLQVFLSVLLTIPGLRAKYGTPFWLLWWSEWAEIPVRFPVYFVAGLALSWLYATIRVGIPGVLAFLLYLVLMIYSTRLFVRMSEVYRSTVESLVPAIEAKILGGPGHSRRVSSISVAIGRKMALPKDDIRKLFFGAMLHDVGLAAIDERILNKKGALTESEYATVLTHVMAGADIVSKSSFLNGCGETILHHHERFDGSGHPNALAGDSIPLSARIVGLAEAYDAMVQYRPYGARLSPEEALREIRAQAGRQFDPAIVPILEQVVAEMSRWGQDVFELNYTLDIDR